MHNLVLICFIRINRNSVVDMLPKRLRKKPNLFLIFYLAVIVLCALAYHFIDFNDCGPLEIGNAFYVSVVTITTLGYGDFYPSSDIGKWIVSIEALSGILLLGMFLVAVAENISDASKTRVLQHHKRSLIQALIYFKYQCIATLVSILNEEYKFISASNGISLPSTLDSLMKKGEFTKLLKDNDSRYGAYLINMDFPMEEYEKVRASSVELLNEIKSFTSNAPYSNSSDDKDVLLDFKISLKHFSRLDSFDHSEVAVYPFMHKFIVECSIGEPLINFIEKYDID